MEYTYLVTGSDGHLGSWVVRKLLKKGKKVRGLRLPNSNYKTPIIEEVFYGDVTKIETLEDFFNVENAKVIHTAGIINVSNKMTDSLYNVNVNGSINILTMCKKKNFPLIYVSSVHAFVDSYKNIDESSIIDPDKVVGPYAKTKAITTKIMEQERNNLPINIIFPTGILGPKDFGNNHLNSVIKDCLHNKLFSYIDGGYDMVDVRDVATFIANLAISDIENENFILSNSFVKVKDFIELIFKDLNIKKKLVKLPTELAKFLAPLSELYYKMLKKPALFSSYSIYTLNNSPNFSHKKATKYLSYRPRIIEKSIKAVIKDLKN